MTSDRNRILIISGALVVLSSLIVGRLFYLQIVKGKEFNDRITTNAGVRVSNSMFDRSSLFFTEKDGISVSAGITVNGYTIVVDRTMISKDKSALSVIAKIVESDEKTLTQKMSDSPSRYVDLVKHVTQSEADSLRTYKLGGVSLRTDKWRFYPGGTLAARTLGFVAFKNDTQEGRYGLERYYNKQLLKNQDDIYGNFFTDVFSSINKKLKKNEYISGDIVTTLEPQVQQKLEQYLSNVRSQYSAEAAGGIVMDPSNGDILAMTYLPSFDLNDFGNVENPLVYSNPNAENVFEFGSIIKPLVMAGAIDAGAVTPETTYIDKGELTFNGQTIHNFDKKARGKATMQDVLTQSLNTGMVFAEQKMGKDVFKKYMLSYQIGEKTGIDLPNETHGLISNLNGTRDIEYANAAFGQGLALTPVEVVKAFSSLANGGHLVSPRIAKSIISSDEKINLIPRPEGPQVISKASSETITRMLTTVVDKGIGGGHYSNPHYSIAAKTGTAQMAMPNGGGYYADRYMHSLFGYYPAYNPKFLVLMYLVYPKNVNYAATTLADPFFAFSKFMLNYYQVPPDR